MPDIITPDTLFFFDGKPGALALYEALAQRLLTEFDGSVIRVKKTQIGFYDPRLYACASLTPILPAARRPKTWLTVTFGLDMPVDSPRLVAVQVRHNRFTHHAVIGDAEDIDRELMGWLRAAHELACR